MVTPPAYESACTDIQPVLSRGFTTRYGGLFALVPFIHLLGIPTIFRTLGIDRGDGIPATNLLRTMLTMTCGGVDRYSHANDIREDRGLAVVAGLSKLPDQSLLHRFAETVTEEQCQTILTAVATGLVGLDSMDGRTVNVDFHNVPAYGDDDELEKHWIPTRNRNMPSVRTLVAQDKASTFPFLITADLADVNASEAIFLVADRCEELFDGPTHLLMDSKVTTYAGLNELHDRGFGFTTLRRRGKKLVERVETADSDEFETVMLDNPRRKYRRLRVLEEEVELTDIEGPVRQLAVTDHGREKPSFFITNDFESSAKELITDYTQRWRIENNISENIDFFSLDKLPSYTAVKIELDLVLTLVSDILYKLFAREVPGCQRMKPETIFRKFIQNTARVRLESSEIVVRFEYFRDQDDVVPLLEGFNEAIETEGSSEIESRVGSRNVRFEFDQRRDTKL